MTCIAAGVLLGAAGLWLRAGPAWSQQMSQPSVRSLSGTIRDSGHEPIHNAVVDGPESIHPRLVSVSQSRETEAGHPRFY